MVDTVIRQGGNNEHLYGENGYRGRGWQPSVSGRASMTCQCSSFCRKQLGKPHIHILSLSSGKMSDEEGVSPAICR